MLGNYPNCPQGLVLYSGPYKDLPEQKLTFLPLYATPIKGVNSNIFKLSSFFALLFVVVLYPMRLKDET
jgi:hypothetical protein